MVKWVWEGWLCWWVWICPERVVSCRFSYVGLIVLTILDSAVDLMISVEFSVEMSGRDENSGILGEVQFGAYYLVYGIFYL